MEASPEVSAPLTAPSVTTSHETASSQAAAGHAGYIVTNEMYNVLYDLYYQRCARQRKPCLVLVRHGSHCRIDLDMTCSQSELTRWGQDQFRVLLSEIPFDEIHTDTVYCWATRVSNRHAERLAKEILAMLEDLRAATPA